MINCILVRQTYRVILAYVNCFYFSISFTNLFFSVTFVKRKKFMVILIMLSPLQKSCVEIQEETTKCRYGLVDNHWNLTFTYIK